LINGVNMAAGKAQTKTARTNRSGGTVDAPGKAHRPQAASARGAKHSNQIVAKIKGAQTMRRGNRRG
jgi:hypothetical protein